MGKTTGTKSDLLNGILKNERIERKSLSDKRDMIYAKFYDNIRLLVATETESMVNVARELGLKSGSRLYDFCYGRCSPSTAELISLSAHYKTTIDNLLNKKASITWE